ncbi:MAG TPA: hypothetical protein VMU66_08540 [Gaiellales bacterium]|nr:hypothetical protein [Gaiellales bacterium]
MDDRIIDVTATEVRRALARSFVGGAVAEHTWRGRVGVGETEVCVDVEQDGADTLVRARASVLEDAALDARRARLLLIENSELLLGRFRHAGCEIVVEHAILAGTTMDAVEVKASVWAVGWAAASFAPRLRALLDEGTPPPPPPLPAGRLRDSADGVRFTDRRVQRLLEQRYGSFQHHPDWGYHGAFGSARVFIDVLAVLDDSTAVRASSPVLSQIDLTDELALHLHERSAEHACGAFLYVPARRELWFQHAVLGDDLDRVELDAAVDLVASVADGCDDELRARFGGLRYADLG